LVEESGGSENEHGRARRGMSARRGIGTNQPVAGFGDVGGRKNVSDCRLLASGQGGCVAMTMNASNTKYFGGWGPTREEAEAAALATARAGTVQKDHTHCQGDPGN
jgi:hypothetical protein